MDEDIRYAIVRCGAIVAWFVLEADRTVCVDALQSAYPEAEYTFCQVDVSDLQGEDQDPQ